MGRTVVWPPQDTVRGLPVFNGKMLGVRVEGEKVWYTVNLRTKDGKNRPCNKWLSLEEAEQLVADISQLIKPLLAKREHRKRLDEVRAQIRRLEKEAFDIEEDIKAGRVPKKAETDDDDDDATVDSWLED
jgi:hypothetical protein